MVDASVLGALAFGEPRADEAAALLDGATLHAPALMAYELAGIARRNILLAPEKRLAIAQALSDALDLEVIWSDVEQGGVLALALEKQLTTYDASYLYLARVLGAELVTFDEALARAAHEG